MVVIPGGTFTMGSPKTDKDSRDDERPQRQVTVASFAAGRFEVTRREFTAFIKDNPQRDMGGCWNWESADWQRRAERNWSNPGFAGYVQSDDDPVVCVSWTDAKDYVAWLNGKAGREVFRLLTEAEWEWAARAQSDPKKPATRFGFGDNETELCDHGNVPDATAKRYNPSWTVVGCIDDYPYTAPVGRFRRNAFGLHDMHGNVWEWVEDAFGTYPMNPTDSRALMPARSEYHVLRGGSWYLDWRHCRSATRNWYAPGIRNGDVGFRLARSLF
ncbi:MAG: formylglycine-generating enzyme family protein [Paracraurococcus sp.]